MSKKTKENKQFDVAQTSERHSKK